MYRFENLHDSYWTYPPYSTVWSVTLVHCLLIVRHRDDPDTYLHKNLQGPKMYLCANVVFSAPDWDEFMGK